MKSGSWSSHQSALPPEARAGGEPDDAEKRRTIPEVVVPGQRYLEADMTPFRWSVVDWQEEECPSCRGVGKILKQDTGEPDRTCLDCQGRRTVGMSPYVLCSDLLESDARQLVFGPAMTALAAEAASAPGVDWLEWQLKLAAFLTTNFP